MTVTPVGIRCARQSELSSVAEIFAMGFAEDPVWGDWAFPDAAERIPLLREFWSPYVAAAFKYDGVIVTDDLSASHFGCHQASTS